MTTAEWKLTLYAGSDFGEIYDLRRDPGERVNLWRDAAAADVRAQLALRLTDHMLCGIDGSNGRVQVPVPRVKTFTPCCRVSAGGAGVRAPGEGRNGE